MVCPLEFSSQWTDHYEYPRPNRNWRNIAEVSKFQLDTRGLWLPLSYLPSHRSHSLIHGDQGSRLNQVRDRTGAMRLWGYAPSFSAHVRLGERGAPVLFLLALLSPRLLRD
jgi:hypothetical protein